MHVQVLPISRQSILVDQIMYIEKWLWQKIEQFSRLKDFHVSLLLMKILFYLYLYVTSYLLLVFISLALCYQLFLISTRFYSNPRGKFKFSGKTKTCLKYPFFQDGSHQTFQSWSKRCKPNRIIWFWYPQMQKVFWKALTDLIIITAQYVYFYSQNLSAISCFTTEGCAQPTSKKTQIRQNYNGM